MLFRGILILFISLWCADRCLGYDIPMWSCDFDHGLCHWMQMKDDDVDWESQAGGVNGIYDHTRSYGKYLVINREDEGIQASLMSPTLKPNNGSCKMTFFRLKYHASSSSKLQVFMVTKLGKRSLFGSSSVSKSWKKEELILESSEEFQIEIVATAGDIWHTDIALDDVLFNDACKTVGKSPIQLVKLSNSPSHNFPEGFLYENNNNSVSRICTKEKAKLACNQLGLTDVLVESSSATGYYSGQEICQPDNITSPVNTSCNTTGCQIGVYWKCKQDYLTICPTLTHNACTSSGSNQSCYSNTQMCDFRNDCPGGEDESNCLNNKRCDFETGTCDWLASKNTFFEWERHGAWTGNRNWRYYMRIDTSHAPTTKSVANLRMIHAVQGSYNSSCSLSFYYHVSGSWSGGLRLMMRTNNTDTSLWYQGKTGSRWSVQWHRKAIQLPGNSTYHLYFQALHSGHAGVGEFGLDNVSFSSGCRFINFTRGNLNLNSSLFHCQSGEVIQRNLVCDFKADCFDGTDESNCSYRVGKCNFEYSTICGWTAGVNGLNFMRRRTGRTPSADTGPTKDHTSKLTSGYYMYFEATNFFKGDFAELLSPTLARPKSGRCTFRWFYHMYFGYSTFEWGKLQILLRNPLTRSVRTVWTKQSNEGNAWKYGSVTFDVDSLEFQMVIRAERGNSFKSDIAIDDVSFSDDCYENSSASITPSVNQICNSTTVQSYSVAERGGRILYPYYLYRSISCKWTISVPAGYRVYLRQGEISAGSSGQYLRVNGSGNGNTSIGGVISGNVSPLYLVSSGNIVEIEFRDRNLRIGGEVLFLFNTTLAHELPLTELYPSTVPGTQGEVQVLESCFETSTESWRDDRSSSPHGSISSQQTRDYSNNRNCNYRFYAPLGYRIHVSFSLFETESHHDYIEIYGVLGRSKLSGFMFPFYFITTGNAFWFRFKTDYSVQKRGFRFTYSLTLRQPIAVSQLLPTTTPLITTVNPRVSSRYIDQYCSGNVRGLRRPTGSDTYGEITSPNYPNNYPHSIRCTWKSLNLRPGKRYVLQLSSFNTELHHDRLVIRDGVYPYSRQLGIFSGTSTSVLRTSSSAFFLEFKSDSSITNRGFRLKYSTYPGCFSSYIVSSVYFSYNSNGLGSVDRCLTACNTSYYKYAAVQGTFCYCGTRDPRVFQLLDPSACSLCRTGRPRCGGSSAFSLYLSSDAQVSTAYTTKAPITLWPGLWTPPNTHNSRQKATSTTPAVVGSLFSVVLILGLLIGLCLYKKSKRQRARTTPRGGNNLGNGAGGVAVGPGVPNTNNLVPNVAYFVAPSQPINPATLGAPPAYSDLVEGRVFFFNQLYGSPTSPLTPINALDPPPSFTDTLAAQNSERPPQYETIVNQGAAAGFQPMPIQVQGAEAGAPPERNASPIPPKPDDGMRISLHSLRGAEALPNSPSPRNEQISQPSPRSNDYPGITPPSAVPDNLQTPQFGPNQNSLPGLTPISASGNGHVRNVRGLPPLNRNPPQDNAAFDSTE